MGGGAVVVACELGGGAAMATAALGFAAAGARARERLGEANESE